MNSKREQAKQLMRHYFRLMAELAGARWDRDNVAEIDDLTDCLIDAAKDEIMEVLNIGQKKTYR
jgi:hypothetical protein